LPEIKIHIGNENTTFKIDNILILSKDDLVLTSHFFVVRTQNTECPRTNVASYIKQCDPLSLKSLSPSEMAEPDTFKARGDILIPEKMLSDISVV